MARGKSRIDPGGVTATRHVALPQPMADRIDIFKGEQGNRSALYRELIELGAAAKWGPRWEEIADALRNAPLSGVS